MAYISDLSRPSIRASRRVSLADLFGLFRQRRMLAQLDDARLRDIGLSRDDAQREARRPLWDVPAHWQK